MDNSIGIKGTTNQPFTWNEFKTFSSYYRFTCSSFSLSEEVEEEFEAMDVPERLETKDNFQ